MYLNFLFRKEIVFFGLLSINSLLQYLYNKPELIRSNLYFFEISLAAVLFPLADSPSQAIINFSNFFTKT